MGSGEVVDSAAGVGEGTAAGVGGDFALAVVGEVLGAKGDGAEGGYDFSLVGQQAGDGVVGERLGGDGTALADECADGAPSLKGICSVKCSFVAEKLDSILAEGDSPAQVAHLVGAAKLFGVFY